jgi:putative FmdB family regulatory protein
MPLYDFECPHCKNEFEYLAKNSIIKYAKCPECGMKAKKIFCATGQNFNLKYNPKSDICDWDGNSSQYYRAYNEAKGRGENVRLPEDGE